MRQYSSQITTVLMWIPCFIPLYSPLNLYLIILWILDFKYIYIIIIIINYQGRTGKIQYNCICTTKVARTMKYYTSYE